MPENAGAPAPRACACRAQTHAHAHTAHTCARSSVKKQNAVRRGRNVCVRGVGSQQPHVPDWLTAAAPRTVAEAARRHRGREKALQKRVRPGVAGGACPWAEHGFLNLSCAMLLRDTWHGGVRTTDVTAHGETHGKHVCVCFLNPLRDWGSQNGMQNVTKRSDCVTHVRDSLTEGTRRPS